MTADYGPLEADFRAMVAREAELSNESLESIADYQSAGINAAGAERRLWALAVCGALGAAQALGEIDRLTQEKREPHST